MKNNRDANISEPIHSSSDSSSERQQSEIEAIANTLFQDIKEDMYNDAEFLQVLQEWHHENDENRTEDEARSNHICLKRKRQ